MKIKFLKSDFTVCKLRDLSRLNLSADLFFFAKTSEELSLVCFNEDVPDNATQVDTGWKCFRVEGTLDFALIGILSKITKILADHEVSVFAVSTYDTDYVLIKEGKVEEARAALAENGYEVA